MPTTLATWVLVLPGCARSTSMTRSWVWPGRARAPFLAAPGLARRVLRAGLAGAAAVTEPAAARRRAAERRDAGESVGGPQQALVLIDARPQDGEPLFKLCTNPFE